MFVQKLPWACGAWIVTFGAIAAAQVAESDTVGGGCVSSASCCVPHGEQGCGDFSCCQTVCGIDSNCCLIGWQQSCADLAGIVCGDTCAGTCPAAGSCCESHSGGGCDDALCCDLVCSNTPSCCEAVWSNTCAGLAGILCGDTCAGACPATGDCCAPHSGGGCDEASCCESVCESMPSCCDDTWSSACSELANQICVHCGEPPRCPTEGDCCVQDRSRVGCESAACCDLVCDDDSFCCDNQWDITCVASAFRLCPNICDCDLFGDFDGNGVVDLADVASFMICYTGADGGPVAEGCECADYDADDAAYLNDLVPLIDAMTP